MIDAQQGGKVRVKRVSAAIAALALTMTTAAFTGVAQSPATAGPLWKTVFSTRFPVAAPLGSFSGCSNWGADICTGLPDALKSSWWAYPAGWPDTATQRDYPVGGYYQPQSTVWISGGQMHIRMSRGTGAVSSAAVVPKAAIGRLYGRYTETARVSRVTTGYKSAHLLWPHGNGAFEVDFPENEWNTAPYAYVHNGNDPQLSFPSNVSWAQWHTYTIGWRPGLLSLYVDGKLIGRTSSATYVPSVPMDWIIQNESALNGEQAPENSSAQIDISYVEYDAYAG
jgi:hypothetical protein